MITHINQRRVRPTTNARNLLLKNNLRPQTPKLRTGAEKDIIQSFADRISRDLVDPCRVTGPSVQWSVAGDP
jgi:hypothetical protein